MVAATGSEEAIFVPEAYLDTFVEAIEPDARMAGHDAKALFRALLDADLDPPMPGGD